MAFKILWTGDPHMASRNLSSRKDSYPDTCRVKLSFVMQTAIKRKVDVVIIPGDLFHDKEESKVSYSLTLMWIKFLSILGQHGIQVAVVPGNHDMQFHKVDISKRPIAFLDVMPNFHFVHIDPLDIERDEKVLSITGSPFLFNNDKGEISERTQYFPDKHRGDYHIHVTHGSLIPFEMASEFQFMDYTVIEDLIAAQPKWDMLINGHIHWIGENNRVMQLGKKVACNAGSLTRGSLKMENLKRKVSIYVADIVDANGELFPTFEEIPVPYQAAESIFDVNEYLEGKKVDKEIAVFMDLLKATTLSERSTNSNLERLIKQADVDETIKEKALEYVANL